MEITCQTDYSQKALAAMSLAARKTIRRRSNRIWSIYAWVLSAVLLMSILVLHDSPLYTALEGALLVLLVTLQFKSRTRSTRSLPGGASSLRPGRAAPSFIPTTMWSSFPPQRRNGSTAGFGSRWRRGTTSSCFWGNITPMPSQRQP